MSVLKPIALIEFADFTGVTRAKVHITHLGSALDEDGFTDLVKRFLAENGFSPETKMNPGALAARFLLWHAVRYPDATRAIAVTTPWSISYAIYLICPKTPDGEITARPRVVFAE